MTEYSEKTKYKIGEFEGPLDLLLYLIKKNEVNIYDIPVSEITEQYIKYLDYSAKQDLENLTEFYIMASNLLYIKSRMLLPVEINLNDELEDPREELVAKLIDYQKFKKLSTLIELRGEESEWHIERKKKQVFLPFEESDDLWEEIEVWDLVKTFSVVMKSLSSERILDLYEEFSMNEKISLINEYLDNYGEFFFTELVEDMSSVMEVVCAFLAILESVKGHNIVIFQNRIFGEIKVKRPEPRAVVTEEFIG